MYKHWSSDYDAAHSNYNHPCGNFYESFGKRPHKYYYVTNHTKDTVCPQKYRPTRTQLFNGGKPIKGTNWMWLGYSRAQWDSACVKAKKRDRKERKRVAKKEERAGLEALQSPSASNDLGPDFIPWPSP